MTDPTYDRFKQRYSTAGAAEAYRHKRFAVNRHWQWVDRREQAVVARFLATLPAGAWAIDMPCGAGRLESLFSAAGVGYVGADISLPMLAEARDALGPATRLAAADALRLPFADRAVDALVAVRLLHRIEERQGRVAMLREMARVTTGPVLVTYYTRWNLRGLKKMLRGRFPGLSAADIREDVRQAGLRIAEATPLGRLTMQQWFFRLEHA